VADCCRGGWANRRPTGLDVRADLTRLDRFVEHSPDQRSRAADTDPPTIGRQHQHIATKPSPRSARHAPHNRLSIDQTNLPPDHHLARLSAGAGHVALSPAMETRCSRRFTVQRRPVATRGSWVPLTRDSFRKPRLRMRPCMWHCALVGGSTRGNSSLALGRAWSSAARGQERCGLEWHREG